MKVLLYNYNTRKFYTKEVLDARFVFGNWGNRRILRLVLVALRNDLTGNVAGL